MNLCSSKHDEICFEGIVCPLCSVKVEYTVLEKENESLLEKLDIAEEEIKVLQEEALDNA